MEKKISIVTPVYNCEQYIERTIISIMRQNYKNYEHIIMDGGSTDATLEIIRKYQDKYPVVVVSEKDNGMYDAICKGFRRANGEIYAWINADDTYQPWAFQVMNHVISDSVNWCTAIPTWQNENDIVFSVGGEYLYNREWIKKGLYDGRCFRFIQQESTFWSAALWNSVDYEKIATYKLAGDFQLWRLFSEIAELYTVKTIIGGFRMRHGQKSLDKQAYYDEAGCKALSRIEKKIYRRLDKRYQHCNKDLLIICNKEIGSSSSRI